MITQQWPIQRLGQGLRPYQRIWSEDQLLYKAYNVRAYREFLDSPETLVNPASGVSQSLPFPQLHIGPYWQLLFEEDSIAVIVPETGAMTPITVYDYVSGAASTITAGGQWHVVDLNAAIYAFNGSCIVFTDGLEEIGTPGAKWYVCADVTMQTGVYSRGRVVTAGFDASNVWSNWTSHFASLSGTTTGQRSTSDGTARATSDGTLRAVSDPIVDLGAVSRNDLSSNWIMWGSIGGGDFPLWLMYPDHPGFDYNMTPDRLEWAIQRNEFGWMPMPWRGTILKMIPLAKHIAIYGTGGVSLITSHTAQQYADAPPTYGLTRSWQSRLACRSAVDGDERGHLMVAADGNLWLLSTELNLQRIGFKEYFEDEADEAIVVLQQETGDFYITMPSASYLFSRGGLTQVMDKVTSAQESYGTVEFRAKQSLELITQEFDMGERARKTVTGLSLSYRGLATVRVAVEYRFRPDQEFSRTPFRILSPEGYAFIRCEGTDFRVVVNANERDEFYLDALRIDYQRGDRRYTRGPTASEVVTPTNRT